VLLLNPSPREERDENNPAFFLNPSLTGGERDESNPVLLLNPSPRGGEGMSIILCSF